MSSGGTPGELRACDVGEATEELYIVSNYLEFNYCNESSEYKLEELTFIVSLVWNVVGKPATFNLLSH